MNVAKLKAMLVGVPDTAQVYIMSDHGQSPEKAGFVSTTNDTELPYYGDDMEWEEPVEACAVTAVRIS